MTPGRLRRDPLDGRRHAGLRARQPRPGLRRGLDPGSAEGLTEALQASHVVRHEFDGGGGVGLGWHVEPSGVVWHNGGTGGYAADLGLHPGTRAAVVVLANTTSREVDSVGREVLRSLD